MKLWKPKEKAAQMPATPDALREWANTWGRQLHDDITQTGRYFREVSALLGNKPDPRRTSLERALNWSTAACFEYEEGRWPKARRDRQLHEAAALLEDIQKGV